MIWGFREAWMERQLYGPLERRRIDRGKAGTCCECRCFVRAKVPPGGDGSLRVAWEHKVGGLRCPGSGRELQETRPRLAPEARR